MVNSNGLFACSTGAMKFGGVKEAEITKLAADERMYHLLSMLEQNVIYHVKVRNT
jgi:molybdopterin-containing oxidoreductase family iron-sulfur binding subunit